MNPRLNIQPMTYSNYSAFYPRILLVALTFVGCGLSSCKRASESKQDAEKSMATITADPNPVPAGRGDGKTTVSWDTGDGSVAEVYLSIDGAEEKLFGKNSKESREANWINNPELSYEFRMYKAGTDRNDPIGSVKVTRNKK